MTLDFGITPSAPGDDVVLELETIDLEGRPVPGITRIPVLVRGDPGGR